MASNSEQHMEGVSPQEGGHMPSGAQVALEKATKGNHNMPRKLRARLGQTTDPIPEGKHIDASAAG